MIEIPRRLYDQIIEHAYRGGAEEVCGVLGGRYEPEHSVVESIHRTDNAADTPEIRYHIDPTEQFEVTERIESAGQQVVGFYHSHPTGPTEPSKTDAERATWPDHSYLIVALDGYPYAGTWRWRENDGFDRERLAVV